MMSDPRLGVADINQQQQERAIALVYESIQQALSGRIKATMITLRVPIHGTKLGQPKVSIERE